MIRGKFPEAAMERFILLLLLVLNITLSYSLLSQFSYGYKEAYQDYHIRYLLLLSIGWDDLMLYNPSADFYEEKDALHLLL